MLKSLLPVSVFLLVFQALSPSLLAQTDSLNRQPSRVTIKSYTRQGDDKIERTIERHLGSEEDMSRIVDSILQNLGIRSGNLSSIQMIGDSMQIILQNFTPPFDSMFGILKEFRMDESLSYLENLQFEGNFFGLNGMSSDEKPSAFLGIVFEDVINDDEEAQAKKGITVTRVSEGSAAQEAGLTANDLILVVEGIEINSIPTLQKLISSKSPGDKINIIYERDGQIGETVATLKTRKPRTDIWNNPKPRTEDLLSLGLPKCDKIIVQKGGPKLGLSITDPNDEARKALKVKSGGALVTKVEKNSCAEGMQLQVNDIIVQLNKQKVESAAHLKEMVGILPLGSVITINYVRYGKKKSASGTLQQYSRAWEEQIPLNIIDFGTIDIKMLENRLQEIEETLDQLGRRAKRRN
jgi:S1-C subfamily serine protease